jgi:hypothetical protein
MQFSRQGTAFIQPVPPCNPAPHRPVFQESVVKDLGHNDVASQSNTNADCFRLDLAPIRQAILLQSRRDVFEECDVLWDIAPVES